MSGVLRRTKEEVYLRPNISISSYYDEVPDQNDMLGLKPSNSAKDLCPRCHVNSNDQGGMLKV